MDATLREEQASALTHGIGALLACALLIVSSPLKMVAGAALIALLTWAGFRLFGSRTAPTP